MKTDKAILFTKNNEIYAIHENRTWNIKRCREIAMAIGGCSFNYELLETLFAYKIENEYFEIPRNSIILHLSKEFDFNKLDRYYKHEHYFYSGKLILNNKVLACLFEKMILQKKY